MKKAKPAMKKGAKPDMKAMSPQDKFKAMIAVKKGGAKKAKAMKSSKKK